MKRDMDLIRAIVLKLEGLDLKPGGIVIFSNIESDFPIDGYTAQEIKYHVDLIIKAGWIDTANAKLINGFGFRALEWSGHDFADSVRDDKIWASTKNGALNAGGFTLDLLTDLAKGFIRKKISEQTGVAI